MPSPFRRWIRRGGVRPPSVAGVFYPAGRDELRAALHTLLRERPSAAQPAPKAVIAPHASLACSGAVAAAAFRGLDGSRASIRRVVLVGPMHHAPVPGVVVPEASAFSTPLGEVPLDLAAVAELGAGGGAWVHDGPHRREYSLEMQLPFLQTILDGFTVVPVLVGAIPPAALASMLERIWGGDETLVVVSSDFGRGVASDARDRDAGTAQRILRGEPGLDAAAACGSTAIDALLLLAGRHGLAARTLGAGTSAPVPGESGAVVGYAAFGFYARPSPRDA